MELDERMRACEVAVAGLNERMAGLEERHIKQGKDNREDHDKIDTTLGLIREDLASRPPKWVGLVFGGGGMIIGTLATLLAVSVSLWR